MKQLVFKVLFILLYFNVIKCKKEIPSFIHVCKRSDPNFSKCLIASGEDLRPYLVTGVPEHNIPCLEPLIMPEFFSEETSGMKLTVSNVSAWGCSDFFVRSFSMDHSTHFVEIDIEIPRLKLEAQYQINGKLLMVQLNGNGDFKANITDVAAKTELKGELTKKDGEDYLHFTDSKLKVKIGGGSIRLEKIFNGDAVLLNMINEALNKNLDMLLEQLMPMIEKALENVIKKTANGVVNSYPYDDLFPA